MKYSSYFNRIIAFIIDLLFVMVCMFIVAMIIFIVATFIPSTITGYREELAFIWIIMVIFPAQILFNVLFSYNIEDFITLMIFFTAETLYYALQEIYKGRTIGFKYASIGIEYQGEKYKILKILLRNSLKTLSRYLFGLPLLTMFLSKKRQAFYDVISGAVVYEVENEK